MKKLSPEDIQNKLHRVVEIYVPGPLDPHTGVLGSGFAVTDDLVLTAKHVAQKAKQVRVRGLSEEWPAFRIAEVVWLSGAWDAALVRLADAPWSSAPDRDEFRLRWVHLSGLAPIPWIAYGFPQAAQFSSGLGKELEAVFGDIIPGGGFKQGVLPLNVKSALPLPTAGHSSPWQGLSGAAILTVQDRKLIGLIAHDPPGFETSRLLGIPVEHLVADPEFARLVGVEHTQAYVTEERVSSDDGLLPINAQYWIDRGDILCSQKSYEEALAAYEQAIILDEHQSEIYRKKGDLLFYLLSRYVDAIAVYDRANQLNPKFANARDKKAVISEIYRKRGQEALASYQWVIDLEPRNSEAHNCKGKVFFYLELYEEALAAYDQAIKLNPNFIEAYCNKSDVLIRLGHLADAQQTRKKAEELAKGG